MKKRTKTMCSGDKKITIQLGMSIKAFIANIFLIVSLPIFASNATFNGKQTTREMHQYQDQTLLELQKLYTMVGGNSSSENLSIADDLRKHVLEIYNHAIEDDEFKAYRMMLDHAYHGVYSQDRQVLQHHIINNYLNHKPFGFAHPTVIFTAGTMGVGKSYTLKKLKKLGFYNDDTFVTIDYDDIKKHLPEYKKVVASSDYLLKSRLGDMTHAESAYIGEVLQHFCMDKRYHLIIDGSLNDAAWFKHVFQDFRDLGYTIKVVYVRATDLETVVANAAHRFRIEGRNITLEAIERTHAKVQQAVASLTPLADLSLEIVGGHVGDQTRPYIAAIRWNDRKHASFVEQKFRDFELLLEEKELFSHNGALKVNNHHLSITKSLLQSWGPAFHSFTP